MPRKTRPPMTEADKARLLANVRQNLSSPPRPATTVAPLPPVSADPDEARRERTAQIFMERMRTARSGFGYIHEQGFDGDRVAFTFDYTGEPQDGALAIARVVTRVRECGFRIDGEKSTGTHCKLFLQSRDRGHAALEQCADIYDVSHALGLTCSYAIEQAPEPNYPELDAIMASVRDDEPTDDYEIEAEK